MTEKTDAEGPAQADPPEFDGRGRRILFRHYCNGGAPIVFPPDEWGRSHRQLKELRKAAKSAAKAFLRRAREAGCPRRGDLKATQRGMEE